MAGLQSEKKWTADGTRFRGCVCPSSSLPSQRGGCSGEPGLKLDISNRGKMG
ncbi:UNVERIFIED_CONTAM: hypothetical protein FKN15_009918 [Acipenser sinensis]